MNELQESIDARLHGELRAGPRPDAITRRRPESPHFQARALRSSLAGLGASLDNRQAALEGMSEAQRQSLRSALIGWLQAKGSPQTDEPTFIKNKFAQLFVGVLRADYPQHWPQAFPQLLGTLGHLAGDGDADEERPDRRRDVDLLGEPRDEHRQPEHPQQQRLRVG